MFPAPYNKLLPAQGDPRKLALKGAQMSGYLPIDDLLRLQELLSNWDSPAQVGLNFGISEEGKLVVSGQVSVALTFTCQRCLKPVTLPVEAEMQLAVVRSEDEAKGLPHWLDPWILAEDGVADLYPLIEEELLLSLPAVAFHPDPCIDERLLSSGTPVEPEPEENPFQVLKQLKGSPKQ